MRKKALLLFALLVAISFVSTGCLIVGGSSSGGSYSDEGSMLIRWTFNQVDACPSDVSEIVIQIGGLPDKIVPCEDGQSRIESLASGDYSVILKGIDDTDEITWQSNSALITVLPGREVVADFDLAP